MKEAKIIIGLLPLAYVLVAIGLCQQDFKIPAAIMVAFSIVFGLLVIGIIANSQKK